MKSVIVSDLHIGELSHGFVDSDTSLNSRMLDIFKRFNTLIKHCLKNDISNIIIAGDVYDLKTPKNLIRKNFAKLVNKTIKAGIKLYILIGNHDISSTSGHALVEMEELEIKGLMIISTPQTISIDNVDFSFFPWNPFSNQDLNHSELIKLKTDKTVLIGHFSTTKTMIEPNNVDFVFLKSLNFDLVFLGHIHKYEELASGIYHISSFTRTDFNEEDEMQYIVEFDHDTFEYDFVEFPDRVFQTFSYDNNISFLKFKNDIEKADLSKKITRMHVVIEENDELHDEIDKLTVYVKNNSWKFYGITKDIIQLNNSFTLTEKVTPNIAFKIYCEENIDSIGERYFKDCYNAGIEILQEGS